MTRCPAHGNRIQLTPSRAVNLIGATTQPDCRWIGTTAAVTAQPLVGRAQADSSLRGEMSQGLSVLNVSTHKPFPTDRCQSGVGVGMHGV
jgi:hypothetical protein